MLHLEHKQDSVLTSRAAMGVLESVERILKWMKQLVEVKSNSAEELNFQSFVTELKKNAESMDCVSTDGFEKLLNDQENRVVLYDDIEKESFSGNIDALDTSSVVVNEEKDSESDESVFDARYVNQQLPQKRVKRRRKMLEPDNDSDFSESDHGVEHETDTIPNDVST